jgi:glutaminyl-peptide cyclotransferase
MPRAELRAAVALIVMVLAAGCARERRPKTAFRGDTALAYVKTQLDFGPRIPGSEGARRAGDWIVTQIRARTDTVIEQRWTWVTAHGDTLPLRNILARIRPSDTKRVLFVTHWDTRPVSDQAPNPADKRKPVPGANDGASGVALLLGVADALRTMPATVGVDLLFVDGEDYGDFTAMRDVLLGSTYFAKHLPEPHYAPLYGVLWDMIGDRDLQIYQEANSLRRAPEVVTLVWRQAAELGDDDHFIPAPGIAITDDHLPLLDAGIHCIDVIDYDYPPHHTPDDTIDKVSAASLQIVGDLAVSLVRQ